MYLADIYTVTADLAGIPGVSLPCGQTREKLPIGLQIVGRRFDDPGVLAVALAFEAMRAGERRPWPEPPKGGA